MKLSEVFKATIPSIFHFAAMDASGTWYAFVEKPTLRNKFEYSGGRGVWDIESIYDDCLRIGESQKVFLLSPIEWDKSLINLDQYER